MEMFANPRSAFLDSSGLPCGSGTVSFYSANSSSPKLVYSDKALTVSLGSSVSLDGAGKFPDSGVFFGIGDYRVVVHDALGNLIDDIPVVPGTTSGSTAGPTTYIAVSAIDNLRNLDAGAYSVVSVLGYYSAGDGCGGVFIWDASETAADNFGTIIRPSSSPASGRWKRLLVSQDLDFGLFGGRPPLTTTQVGANASAAINWLSTNRQYALCFPSSRYFTNISLSFPSWLTIKISSGTFFDSEATSANIEFLGPVEIDGRSYIVSGGYLGHLSFGYAVCDSVDPGWFGAEYQSSDDQSEGLSYAYAGAGGNPVEITATLTIGATVNATSPTIFSGSGKLDFISGGVCQFSKTITADPMAQIFSGLVLGARSFAGGPTEVYPEWFGASTSLSDNSSIIDTISRYFFAGYNGGTIAYNGGTYRFSTAYSDPSSKDIVHKLRSGSILSPYSGVLMALKSIDAPNSRCLSNTADSISVSGQLKPHWFGCAETGDASIPFQNCLTAARYGSVVDGFGLAFTASSTVSHKGISTIRNIVATLSNGMDNTDEGSAKIFDSSIIGNFGISAGNLVTERCLYGGYILLDEATPGSRIVDCNISDHIRLVGQAMKLTSIRNNNISASLGGASIRLDAGAISSVEYLVVKNNYCPGNIAFTNPLLVTSFYGDVSENYGSTSMRGTKVKDWIDSTDISSSGEIISHNAIYSQPTWLVGTIKSCQGVCTEIAYGGSLLKGFLSPATTDPYRIRVIGTAELVGLSVFSADTGGV